MIEVVHHFDHYYKLLGSLGVEPQKALFNLGEMTATVGALDALEMAGQTPDEFLQRHQTGDWGDLGEDDKQINDFSVDETLRIFSAYHTNKGEKLWIITEADRSSTTILLPCEY